MITIGGKDVADIVIDNKNVIKIQDAITLDIMWQKTQPVVIDYFYIENTYSGNNTLSITPSITGSPSSTYYTTTLEYSTDKVNWTTLNLVAGTASTISMSEGDKVYFRNDNGKFNYWSTSDRYSITFTCDQNHNAGGNINTLLNYTYPNNVILYQGCFQSMFINDAKLVSVIGLELPSTTLAAHCYRSLFNGCTSLTDSPTLPATTMYDSCYRFMFSGCTTLTTAPTLPATTLYNNCYQQMFSGCSSLTSTPTLPATTLTSSCYQAMFENCTGLISVQALPATTLASSCYAYMFKGCSSLVNAPALPATTLVNNCYRQMFYNCTSLVNPPTLRASSLISSCYREMFYNCSSLNHIRVYANNNSASYCIDNWLYGVASTGTFYNYGSATYQTQSASGIPTGWTEIITTDYFYIENTYPGQNVLTLTTKVGTSDPDYNATTVQYSNDEITWTTLTLSSGATNTINMSDGERIYFRNDTGVFNSDTYLYTSFTCSESCDAGGDLRTLINWRASSVILPRGCFYRLFYNNTKLETAPTLSFTTLHNYCYASMFEGCTNLVNVSNLPATTLYGYCYDNMFKGCTSLVYAPAISATTLSTACCRQMFYGCTSLVDAPALQATTLQDDCYEGMFNGCTSLVNAPALPATHLVNDCYNSMFYGCTSLVNAPDISHAYCDDVSSDQHCCKGMYTHCYNLANVYAPRYAWGYSDNYGCFDYWVQNAGRDVVGNKYMYAWSQPTAGMDGLGVYTYVQIINNVE